MVGFSPKTPPTAPGSSWPQLGELLNPISDWTQQGIDYYQNQLANIGKSPSGIDYSISPDTMSTLMALGGPIGEGGGFRAGRNKFMIPKNPSYVESQAAQAAAPTAAPAATPAPAAPTPEIQSLRRQQQFMEATGGQEPQLLSGRDRLINQAYREGVEFLKSPEYQAWKAGGRKAPRPKPGGQ